MTPARLDQIKEILSTSRSGPNVHGAAVNLLAEVIASREAWTKTRDLLNQLCGSEDYAVFKAIDEILGGKK